MNKKNMLSPKCMHICFICQNSYQCSENFLSHLKSYHKTPNTFQYQCKYELCQQRFQNFFKFKKHIEKHNCIVINQSNDAVAIEPPSNKKQKSELPHCSQNTINSSIDNEINLVYLKKHIEKTL